MVSAASGEQERLRALDEEDSLGPLDRVLVDRAGLAVRAGNIVLPS